MYAAELMHRYTGLRSCECIKCSLLQTLSSFVQQQETIFKTPDPQWQRFKSSSPPELAYNSHVHQHSIPCLTTQHFHHHELAFTVGHRDTGRLGIKLGGTLSCNVGGSPGAAVASVPAPRSADALSPRA